MESIFVRRANLPDSAPLTRSPAQAPGAAPDGLSPMGLYEQLLSASPSGALLRHDDGRVTPLALDRWLGPSGLVEDYIAAAAAGPVLDIGCGPGRMLDAFACLGTPALGVDLSRVAVGLARARGQRVLLGSVFDELPGAGEWGTALLLDGNVGIGGDPVALLSRIAILLRAGGLAVLEVEPPGSGTRSAADGLRRLD